MHVLCLGITPDDHDRLQARAPDVETVAEYLHEHEIACALAHPFYAVTAPLTPRHRRRLAQLFPVWETRNGSRAPELNSPAAVYIDTHGGIGIGGTDDHAGVDIGRTYTETPPAGDAGGVPRERPRRPGDGPRRAGQRRALDARRDGARDPRARPRRRRRAGTDPMAVLRSGRAGRQRGQTSRAVLRRGRGESRPPRTPAPCCARGCAPSSSATFGSTTCWRSSRRTTSTTQRWAAGPGAAPSVRCATPSRARSVARATASRHRCPPRPRRCSKLASRPSRTPRRRRSWDAREAAARAARGRAARRPRRRRPRRCARRDTDDRRAACARRPRMGRRGDRHGCRVGRRLSAVTEVEVPSYPGLEIGVPSLPAVVDALAEGRYDVVHVTAPGRPEPWPRCSPGSWTCRSSRASTPSSPSTPACAPATHSSRRPPRWRSRSSTAPPTTSCRRAPRRMRRCVRSASTTTASAAGTAASTRLASRRDHRVAGLLPGERTVLYAGRWSSPPTQCGPRAAPRARGRGPRGGGAARPPRRARDLPRLAGGRRTRPRLCQRRHLPLPEPDRHLRPGRPRGAGQRTAGDRGRRGRPPRRLVARRRHGPPAPLDPDALGAGSRRAGRRPADARPARAHGRSPPSADRTWDRALARLAAGYRTALAPADFREVRHSA